MNEAHPLPHQILLNDRQQLQLTGVSDVTSFDENTVTVRTSLGELTIKGHHLNVCRLCVESGDLSVEGTVDSLEYFTVEPRRSLLGRLFR